MTNVLGAFWQWVQLGVVCVNVIYFSFLRADEFISTNIIKHTSNYYFFSLRSIGVLQVGVI